MKVEFRRDKEGEAYIELQPENLNDQGEQEVLKQIYQAGFASGSGSVVYQDKGMVFSHVFVAAQKKPRP